MSVIEETETDLLDLDWEQIYVTVNGRELRAVLNGNVLECWYVADHHETMYFADRYPVRAWRGGRWVHTFLQLATIPEPIELKALDSIHMIFNTTGLFI